MAARLPIYVHVGRRLGRLRDDQGLTQETLAEKASGGGELQLSVSQLSKMETGDRNLHLHRLEQLARTLGVPMGEFFVGYAPKPRSRGARETAAAYGQSDERGRLLAAISNLGPKDIQALLVIAERLVERSK